MAEKVTPLHSSVKIVVVDDSEFSRSSITSILEKEGFNVVGEADNAKNAIDVVNSKGADIIIIDIVMPDVNGVELAKYFHENYSKLEIIMISSLGHENLIIEAISSGAKDFLQKPFSPDQLLTSVSKIVESIESR